jgi:hypothetical protein
MPQNSKAMLMAKIFAAPLPNANRKQMSGLEKAMRLGNRKKNQ